MVLRVLRFRVPARHGHRVFAHARRLAGPDAPDGLLHVSVGRQQDGPTDAFILVTEWRDIASLYGWVHGPELLSAIPSLGELSELASDIDLQHYEGPGEQEPQAGTPGGSVAPTLEIAADDLAVGDGGAAADAADAADETAMRRPVAPATFAVDRLSA